MEKDFALQHRAFTSPEESKLLLQLGLPHDTADMYYEWMARQARWFDLPELLEQPFNKEQSDYPQQRILPCWTATKLIDLFVENMKWPLRVRPDKKMLTVTSIVRNIQKYGRNIKLWTL